MACDDVEMVSKVLNRHGRTDMHAHFERGISGESASCLLLLTCYLSHVTEINCMRNA